MWDIVSPCGNKQSDPRKHLIHEVTALTAHLFIIKIISYEQKRFTEKSDHKKIKDENKAILFHCELPAHVHHFSFTVKLPTFTFITNTSNCHHARTAARTCSVQQRGLPPTPTHAELSPLQLQNS